MKRLPDLRDKQAEHGHTLYVRLRDGFRSTSLRYESRRPNGEHDCEPDFNDVGSTQLTAGFWKPCFGCVCDDLLLDQIADKWLR